MKYWWGSREIDNYAYLYESIKNDALRQRAKHSLEYYINKATICKFAWGLCSCVGVALPAFATFCASTGADTVWVAGLTITTTIVSGVLAIFKFADKKTSYRNSAEYLKSELSSYMSKSGVYKDHDSSDEILANKLEQIIADGYKKIELLESSKGNGSINN